MQLWTQLHKSMVALKAQKSETLKYEKFSKVIFGSLEKLYEKLFLKLKAQKKYSV
jgi:hypothetical protein